MKKDIFLMALASLLSLTAIAVQQKPVPAKTKKDTVKDVYKAAQPNVVKGNAARQRLQLQQIKYHDKQQKKIDSLDMVIQKDTKKLSIRSNNSFSNTKIYANEKKYFKHY